MLYFTPLPGFFSPFPHGTRSLSVTGESLALEGGPPGFSQGSSVPPTYSGTRVTVRQPLRLQGSHLLWRTVPGRFNSRFSVLRDNAPHRPYNPGSPKRSGLGSSQFARRYFGNLA